MAIDISKLPPVLPVTVARVTKDGLPTKHLIDWEQYTRDWYGKSAVDLDTRLTEVKSDTDNAHARITEETNARTSADSALAEQITTVEATVGNVTANGAIYFGAAATPAGAVAAYGLYLTAGNAFTGMEAIARTDGTSAIGFKAATFVFTDSGTEEQVFTYASGQFTLTGNVRVNGSLVVEESLTTGKLAPNSVTNIATAACLARQTATAMLYANHNDKILVIATLRNDAIASNSGTPNKFGVIIKIDGSSTLTDTFELQEVETTSNVDGATIVGYTRIGLTRQFVYNSPSTGNHTVTAEVGDGARVDLTVISFSR